MQELFRLLGNSSIAIIFFIALFSILIFFIIIIYLIAFIQGRGISFWPPKIGKKEFGSQFKGRLNEPKFRSQEGKNATVILYPNRETLISLDKIIIQAQKEIILYSVQHGALVHQCLGLLQQKAESGCKIKILMMAPKNSLGEINPNVLESESHRRYKGLLSQIESSTKSLKEWVNSLNFPAQKMIEIRTYQECPIATYLFIDKDDSNGFVQVELLLYGIHVQDMPHYIVYKNENERFLKTHIESFEKLWANSAVLSLIN